MKTVYLHIGPHKTGTTHIQRVFHENADYFLKKHSLYYPTDYKIIFGHHDLVNQLKTNTFDSERMRKSIDTVDADSVLFSSENFDVLSDGEVEIFLSALSCYDVKIIAMFREPSLRLYSWWQEEVKHGSEEMFPEYALPHLCRPMKSDIFNLDIVLSRYGKFLEKEAIYIGDYESFSNSEGIEEFFERILSVDIPKMPKESRFINKGLAEFDIEVIRVMNSISKSISGLTGSVVREVYLKNKSAVDSDLLKRLMNMFDASLYDVEIGDLYQDRAIYQEFSMKYDLIKTTNFKRDILNTTKKIPKSTWYIQDGTYSDLKAIYSQLFSTKGSLV